MYHIQPINDIYNGFMLQIKRKKQQRTTLENNIESNSREGKELV